MNACRSIRSGACLRCPFRRDVPSGLWHPSEYAKLPPYDAPTGEQPVAGFLCHATPEAFCHGWAVVGSTRGHDRQLLALRLAGVAVDDVPLPSTPLFASGTEAADHGLRDVEAPSPESRRAAQRLVRKHARLLVGLDHMEDTTDAEA